MRWNELKSHFRHLSTGDLHRIEQAFELGKEVHKDQKRKSGEPYFTHPLQVAMILADMGADTDTVIAALLHDAIEDTDLQLKEVDAKFDGSVAKLIDGVTKLDAKELQQKPTLDQQIESLRKMFTLMQQDVRVMVIKLVDRLHNMQTIEFLAPDRQAALAKETMEVYVKIADRLCMQDLRNELEELCLSVLDPVLLKTLLVRRERNEPIGKQIARDIEKHVRAAARSLPVEAQFEQSSWERLQVQIGVGEAAVTGSAPFSVALVTHSIDDCYRLMGMLHQIWQREILSFQDFINSPAINGYRGLHTTVILEDGTRVRCKIRTKEMHEYARKGIAAGCFQNEVERVYLPWVQRISPLSEDTQDRSENFWQSLQSDVLGESIVVHGPGDETVMLPKGASALDAAFYLYGGRALRAKTIVQNGKSVPFHTQLAYADSIEVHFSTDHTVSHEWFSWVVTGMARANIRQALSAQPVKKKLEQGKLLLQEEFDRYGAGNVERRLQHSAGLLADLDVKSLNELFTLVAEGVVTPSNVLEHLQKHQPRLLRKWPSKKKVSCLRIRIHGVRRADQNIHDTIDRLSQLTNVIQQRVTIQQHKNTYTATVLVCAEEKNNIDRFFAQLEAQPDVQRISAMPSTMLIVQLATVFLLTLTTWLASFFSLQSIGSQHMHALITYALALPIVLCNIVAYRYVSDYVAVARRSRLFIGTILVINAIMVAFFTVNMLQGGLDVLHLSLFFPLTLVVLSGIAIIWTSAMRSAPKELPTGVKHRTEAQWREHQRQKAIGYLIRLGAVVIWGIEPLYIKYTVVNDIDPSLRVFLKAGGGMLPSLLLGALLVWGIGSKKRFTLKLPYNSVFMLIVVSEMIFTYLMNSSLIYTSSTNVILLSNFGPVIALIIAAIFWRDQIPYLRQPRSLALIFILFIMGSIGSTLLFYNDIRFATPTHLWGDSLGMMTMLVDVCLVIAMIRYVQSLPVGKSIELNFNVFLFSFLLSAPLALFGASNIWQLSLPQLLFGIGAGVLSGFGRIMNFAAFRRIDGFLALLMFNISIFITFAIEVFYIKGTHSTPLLVVGGLVIIIASALAEFVNSKSEREQY
jgi:RelA/SpoT family (p)ppGpp synthetase